MKRRIRRMKFRLCIFILALAIHLPVTMVYTSTHFPETHDHNVVVSDSLAGSKPIVRSPWYKNPQRGQLLS